MLALPVLALAACGGDGIQAGRGTGNNPAAPNPSARGIISTAPCPRIVILADGADLTRFRPGGGQDLTAMVADARIAGFEANCDFTSRARTEVNVRITPRFEAERGPAATGSSLDLPWFIALTDTADTEVLDRQAFATRANFGANVSRTTVTGQTVRMTVPLSASRTADYNLRISFQLTPDELAMNRRRGPR